MKKVMLIAILLMCAALMAIGLVSSGSDTAGSEGPPDSNTRFAKGIRAAVYGDDGLTLKYLIIAPVAGKQNDGQIKVDDPIIYVYDVKKNTRTIVAKITADEGYLVGTAIGTQEAAEFSSGSLDGHVRVQTDPDAAQKNIQLTTDHLEHDFKAGILHTATPVRVAGDGRSIDSKKGIRANPDLNWVDFLGDVSITLPLEEEQPLHATTPGRVRVEQFDLTQQVGRRQVDPGALPLYDELNRTRSIAEGALFAFSKKTLASWPIDPKRNLTSDATQAILRATGDLFCTAREGGTLIPTSGRITDLGPDFLHAFAGRTFPRPSVVDPEAAVEVTAGRPNAVRDGHCYLIEAPDGNAVLFRVLGQRGHKVRIQWIYQPDGTRRFGLSQVTLAPKRANPRDSTLRTENLSACGLPHGMVDVPILGVTEAIRITFDNTRTLGEQVVIITEQAQMKADAVTLFAYRNTADGKDDSDGEQSERGVKPLYMEALDSVTLVEESVNDAGEPEGSSEAHGDRLVWQRAESVDGLLEEMVLTRDRAKDGGGTLWAKYITVEKKAETDPGERDDPLLRSGEAAVLDVNCDDKMVFTRTRAGAKGASVDSRARFTENVRVIRTPGDDSGETEISASDTLELRFAPTVASSEAEGPAARRKLKIKQMEAWGDVRIKDPERKGWAQRLLLIRDYNDGEQIAETHVMLTGAPGHRPGVEFTNASAQIAEEEEEDGTEKKSRRSEIIKVTCSDTNGKLVFDRGVTDARGRGLDDVAVASGDVIVERWELDEKGDPLGDPGRLNADLVTMIIDPGRVTEDIEGLAEGKRRVKNIVAQGRVKIDWTDGQGTGDRMVWHEEETADGLLRTTELFGTPTAPPTLTMEQEDPDSSVATVIHCSEKIVFTQMLYAAHVNPRVKEQMNAALLGDVNLVRDESNLKKGSSSRTTMDGERVDVTFKPVLWRARADVDPRQFNTIVVHRGEKNRVHLRSFYRDAKDTRVFSEDHHLIRDAKGDRLIWKDNGRKDQTATLKSLPGGKKCVVISYKQGKLSLSKQAELHQFKDIPVSGSLK